MDWNVAQVVVTTVAVALIMTPLVVVSYVAGRRSKTTGKSLHFEQLQCDLVLGGSTWQVDYDGETEASEGQSITLELNQTGCRIVATGHSSDGTHSLEGIVHQRRLCCVSIDESRDGIWLGTVTAELQADDQRMTGMRARWSAQSQTLMVRKATFTRLPH